MFRKPIVYLDDPLLYCKFVTIFSRFRTLPPDSQLVEVEKSAEDHQRELVALFGVLSGKITTRTLYSSKARFDRTALRAEIRELVDGCL